MARLRFVRLCIRPIILFALLAIFGLAFAAPPVMAEGAPINNINPDNTTADDSPWVEFTDHPTDGLALGPQFMVMHVAEWLVDLGLVEVSHTSVQLSTNRRDSISRVENDNGNHSDIE